MKELSIIIPVYNVQKYLEDCLLSIYKQSLSLETFEVIAVNDGQRIAVSIFLGNMGRYIRI